jgi:uncharacterized protein with HEPN domain
MRHELLHLEDILSAAEAITEFLSRNDFDSFAADRLVRSAVAHQLMIIGEAAGRLSPATRERYPDVPWTDVRGLRNIVVHNYFGTDSEEIWRTAKNDVPVLSRGVSEIIRAEYSDE